MSTHQPLSRAVQTVKPHEVSRDESGRNYMLTTLTLQQSQLATRAEAVEPRWNKLTDVLAGDGEFAQVAVEELGGKTIHRVGRISLVNRFGDVVYDSFAHYREQEGYKKKLAPAAKKLGVYWPDIKLHNGARPIEEIEANVRELIQGRKVVMHAAHEDIKVFSHGLFEDVEIRDTQLLGSYREHATGSDRKPGLKTLAQNLLGRDIQGKEHLSVEDARATMELYLKEEAAFEAEQGSWKVTPDSRWWKYGIENAADQEYDIDGEGEEEPEATTVPEEIQEIIDTDHLKSMPITTAASFWKTGATTVKDTPESSVLPMAPKPYKPLLVQKNANNTKESKSPASSSTTASEGHSRSSSDSSNTSPSSVSDESSKTSDTPDSATPSAPLWSNVAKKAPENTAAFGIAPSKQPAKLVTPALWSKVAAKSEQAVDESKEKAAGSGKLILKPSKKKV